MDMLLKEMQDMDKFVQKPIPAPSVINEVSKLKNPDQFWAPTAPKTDESLAEFWQQSLNPDSTVNQRAKQEANVWGWDQNMPSTAPFGNYRPYQRPNYSRFLDNQATNQNVMSGQPTASDFFNEIETEKIAKAKEPEEDWAEAFQETKKAEEEFNDQYNKEFWDKLQDEWKKLSEDNTDHPWLNEFSDYYDPYKEYKFDENNPMVDIENALEKGKTFLQNGDIPSAVLCFEAAVKQEPVNAEAWQYLGTTQAENEKDPNAIAALKKSLELDPNNLKVLMSLAISYTNESYQNQALKMLNQWMRSNPKYSNLVPADEGAAGVEEIASSRIRGMELELTQELFLQAVHQNASGGEFDVDVQEALGVLFNLSSEYEKAVDCFQAAVQMAPENAKLWNRLGASYANGNKPTEAVGAYQRALEIEPGFIRARYNVGVVCINLKSYKEAAEHLLLALNHQATSKERAGVNVENIQNQMSDTLWSTLRMTISLMGKHDLQDNIDKRDLEALNKEFGM